MTTKTGQLVRYGDDPNYGREGAFASRIDWLKTMHANLSTQDQTREFMVRLISMLECDTPDRSFEKRVLDVLKAMSTPEEPANGNGKARA